MPLPPIQRQSGEILGDLPQQLPVRGPMSMVPPKGGSLKGKTVVVVFNRNARDGEIAREYEQLETVLQGEGAEVITVMTVPDPIKRRNLIFENVFDLLQKFRSRPTTPVNNPSDLPPIWVMPFGGDGIFGETVQQTAKAAGISFHPEDNSWEVAEQLKGQVGFFLVDKGKAADNAKQVMAPEKVGAIPQFAKRAVVLPFAYTLIETPSPNGTQMEVAAHSYSAGVGGYLFAKREENLAKNPHSFWNKGIKSYLRLLHHVALNRYGLLGFEVEVKHYNASGGLKKVTKQLTSELMITPNRLIAKFGGVPGAWGQTKLIMLPPGGGGILGLAEYVFRGVATKLGWNQVSSKHSMKLISHDREINLGPGEWLEVETRVPVTSWDLLRKGKKVSNGGVATEPKWVYQKLGSPPVPPAGAPVQVPTILNGDVVQSHPRFKVYAPDYFLNELADPESLGVSLARDSALVDGRSPLISDQNLVAHVIPEDGPKIMEMGKDYWKVRTPFLSQRRLNQIFENPDLNPTPKRIPDLIIGTQKVEKPEDLVRLANRDLTVEKVNKYFLSLSNSMTDKFSHRLWRGGVPLAMGLGALWAGEKLADQLGLDPNVDRELRFALMMYSGHALQANVAPIWEVIANRSLGRPYDFVRTREVRVAGERLAQWTFGRYRWLPDAMETSWKTGALALESGTEQSLWRWGAKAATIPVRAAWNMGSGLICSRLTDGLVQALDAPKIVQDYAGPASFFLPDVAQIAFPRATTGLLNIRGINLGGRIFAAGFIADMAFASWQHSEHGSNTTQARRINAMAAGLRRLRSEESHFSWRSVVHFLSPTLADHIDSHEYGFGKPNVYHQMAEEFKDVTKES